MHVELPEKRYYGIGEVAEAFGVNTSLIRFWEKEFDILKLLLTFYNRIKREFIAPILCIDSIKEIISSLFTSSLIRKCMGIPHTLRTAVTPLER